MTHIFNQVRSSPTGCFPAKITGMHYYQGAGRSSNPHTTGLALLEILLLPLSRKSSGFPHRSESAPSSPSPSLLLCALPVGNGHCHNRKESPMKPIDALEQGFPNCGSHLPPHLSREKRGNSDGPGPGSCRKLPPKLFPPKKIL